LPKKRYMMLVVLALFTWFALSVPATLIVGRFIAANSRDRDLPYPTGVATSGQRLVQR